MVKFVQMVSHLGRLYLLDERGWLYVYNPDYNSVSVYLQGVPE